MKKNILEQGFRRGQSKNKTVLVIDHEFIPSAIDKDGLLNWARGIRGALACGQAEKLPRGVGRLDYEVLEDGSIWKM
jgi:hypothetical protein